MSLVVALRVPDGIVVGADSQSVVQYSLSVMMQEVDFPCPNCKEKVSLKEFELPLVPVPSSASSYSQKVFPLCKHKYAVACYGLGIVNSKSMEYHLQHFEQLYQNDIDSLHDLVAELKEFFEAQLLKQYPKFKEDAPDDWNPVQLLVNGFEETDSDYVCVTNEIKVGKKSEIRRHDTTGCTIGGQSEIVKKFWEIGSANKQKAFKFNLFTLQDAVDHCNFLIGTTSNFQRFSNEVTTVGGDIDIALLTPFHGFKWIQRKSLMRRMDGENE